MWTLTATNYTKTTLRTFTILMRTLVDNLQIIMGLVRKGINCLKINLKLVNYYNYQVSYNESKTDRKSVTHADR